MFSSKKVLSAKDSTGTGTYFYFKTDPDRPPPLQTDWPSSGVANFGGHQVFYMDENFTIPATTPPSASDTVVFSGSGMVRLVAANSSGWSGNLIAKDNIIFEALAFYINVKSAKIYGNVVSNNGFEASEIIFFGGNSKSNASQKAPIIVLDDHASNGGGLVGNVVMNGCSYNGGGISGNLTLNDHARSEGSASGVLTNNSDGVCPN